MFLRVDQEKGVDDEIIVHELVHILDHKIVPLEEFKDNDTMSSNSEELFEFLKSQGVEKVGCNAFFPEDFISKDKISRVADFGITRAFLESWKYHIQEIADYFVRG